MIKPKPTATELGLMQGSPPSPEKQVTLQNWYVGDPVRWSFKNIEQLLPCAYAYRGAQTVSPLPKAKSVDIDHIEFTNHDGTQWTIGDMLNHTYTDAFVVIHKGKIINERYIDMRPNQRHLLQSVSKSLTACLLAVMVECGEIDVGKTIASYLPEFANSAYADATIQQVLDMTASIKYDETYDDMLSDVNLHTIAGGWYGHVERVGAYADVPQSLYDYLPTLTKKTKYAHGEQFHYVSANTDVLGILLERVSGRSFMDLFETLIWQPLAPEEDCSMTLDPLGGAFPCGGFSVTARDLGRFGLMVLNNGRYAHQQIIPASFITDTLTNGDNAAWHRGDGYSANVFPNGSYRNQFWNTGNDHGAFFCVGIHGQYCYMDKTADMVIIKLSSHPTALVEENSILSLYGFHAIAKHLMS